MPKLNCFKWAQKKKNAQIGRTPVSGCVRSKHRQWNFRWCEISGDVNKFRWTTYAKSPGAYVWKGKKWRWLWASPSENGAHAQFFGQASTLSFEAPTLWWNHYARKKKRKRNRTRFVTEKKKKIFQFDNQGSRCGFSAYSFASFSRVMSIHGRWFTTTEILYEAVHGWNATLVMLFS